MAASGSPDISPGTAAPGRLPGREGDGCMKSIPFILLAGLLAVSGARAEEPALLNLSLEHAVVQAYKTSNRLQAKLYELEAYHSREAVNGSLLWPRLTLEASWKYMTNVPEIAVMPRMPAVKLGDNNNYSVGPMLTWSIMESGGTYFAWRAAQAVVRAKENEVEALRREIRLRTQMAYFQTQMALAQNRLIADQLRLSQVQYRDIRNQTQAGQASRIDLLSAHQDVINNQRQLRLAQTDLASALRDLLNWTGGGEGIDPTRPADAGTTPAGEAAPTVRLALDPLPQSLARLEAAAHGRPDPEYPQAQMFLELAEANRRSADSLGTGHWPKVQLSAKTSLDYPNGPVLETVNQNLFGVNVSWSLYEFGRVAEQTAEQRHNAEMNAKQADQTRTDVLLAWNKARDQVAQFREVQEFDRQAVGETDELARLVYQAYRTGRSTYLEVQNANYRALGAKIQSVRTNVQLLMQLATLESLTAPDSQENRP